MSQYPIGAPGVQSVRTATPRKVLLSGDGAMYFPSSKVILGANARDPLNTGDLPVLRAGMAMGRVTSDNSYAPSIIGVTTAAYADGDLTITVGAATATEIAR